MFIKFEKSIPGWFLRRDLHPVLRAAEQGDADRDADAGAVPQQLEQLEAAGRDQEGGEGEGEGREGQVRTGEER